MQFKLTDLIKLITYCAVGAWLWSLGVGPFAFVFVLLGAIVGFEIGRRTDHPTFLMTGCGAVMGLCILTSVWMHLSQASHGKLFLLFDGADLLAIPPWILAGGIFWWLITRLKNVPRQRQ